MAHGLKYRIRENQNKYPADCMSTGFMRLTKKLCKPPLSDRINNGGYLYGQEGKESAEATD